MLLLYGVSDKEIIGLCHGSGNRTNEQIFNYGTALGAAYHYIIISEFDPRERVLGEAAELVKEGLLSGGCDPNIIKIIFDPDEAIECIFSLVKSGDLLVIQLDELKNTISKIMDKFRQVREEL